MYLASSCLKVFFHQQDICTADSENKIFETAASFEESERKQNALEKCDACLIGEWPCKMHVRLLKTGQIKHD